jgi:hypothetical protein
LAREKYKIATRRRRAFRSNPAHLSSKFGNSVALLLDRLVTEPDFVLKMVEDAGDEYAEQQKERSDPHLGGVPGIGRMTIDSSRSILCRACVCRWSRCRREGGLAWPMEFPGQHPGMKIFADVIERNTHDGFAQNYMDKRPEARAAKK